MNGGLNTDATLGRTARAALEHLRRQLGLPDVALDANERQ